MIQSKNWDEICQEKIRAFIDGIIVELRNVNLLKSSRTGHAELSKKVLGKDYRDAVRDRYRKTKRGMELNEILEWFISIRNHILDAGDTRENLRALEKIKKLFKNYKNFVEAQPWNTRILIFKNKIHPRSKLIEVIRKIIPEVCGFPISNPFLSLLIFNNKNYLDSGFLHTLRKGEEGRINPSILFEIMYKVSQWRLQDFEIIKGIQPINRETFKQIQSKVANILKKFIYLNCFSAQYIRYGVYKSRLQPSIF